MHNSDTIINTDVADQRQHPLHRPQEVSIVDIRMPFWSMVRIPRPFGHPVHAHSATQSTVIRPPLSGSDAR
jgi:hypothetical protein